MMPSSLSSSYSYSCPAPKKRLIEEDATYHHSRPHLFFDSSTSRRSRTWPRLNIAVRSVVEQHTSIVELQVIPSC